MIELGINHQLELTFNISIFMIFYLTFMTVYSVFADWAFAAEFFKCSFLFQWMFAFFSLFAAHWRKLQNKNNKIWTISNMCAIFYFLYIFSLLATKSHCLIWMFNLMRIMVINPVWSLHSIYFGVAPEKKERCFGSTFEHKNC